ncbi:MAG: peptidylprolyl isomerase, partial [Thermoanaerobaculia bacterium]|nr:peptidylprolyl isomerase [Thermoanaerobaculia bacterium]
AVLAALDDADPGLRAAALEWLAGEPVVPLDRRRGAVPAAAASRMPLRAIHGARAIAARGRLGDDERERAVELLEGLAAAPEYLLRREAADLLAGLGRPRPEPGAVDTGRSLDAYRDLARRASRDPEVELLTRQGAIRLRLLCAEAPLTCVNFLQLAGQGFYDGLSFHRVVPDFVVQSGDPRGDGWGGPGYAIRDENGPVPYTRGTVGMALSGPDTGGSQFFVTLSEQPHLEGFFPAFARVVGGDELLDRIVQGDTIDSLRELP